MQVPGRPIKAPDSRGGYYRTSPDVRGQVPPLETSPVSRMARGKGGFSLWATTTREIHSHTHTGPALQSERMAKSTPARACN